ncbi:MAG: B3/4 domain-containing protein [Anaerotignaceae bacterium]
MKILIDEKMKQKYPNVRLGCIRYTAQVKETNAQLWDVIDHTVSPRLISEMETINVTEFKNIATSRAAYKAFGKDPGRYRVSSEALYRRIKQGKGLYKINTVVDTNNLISLETGFSVGSYDIENIDDTITLKTGLDGESYKGIGKESVNIENLPVLVDKDGAFGSPTSDSTRAMITENSKEILTVIYDFSTDYDLEGILKKSADYFAKFTSATNIETFIV